RRSRPRPPCRRGGSADLVAVQPPRRRTGRGGGTGGASRSGRAGDPVAGRPGKAGARGGRRVSNLLRYRWPVIVGGAAAVGIVILDVWLNGRGRSLWDADLLGVSPAAWGMAGLIVALALGLQIAVNSR